MKIFIKFLRFSMALSEVIANAARQRALQLEHHRSNVEDPLQINPDENIEDEDLLGLPPKLKDETLDIPLPAAPPPPQPVSDPKERQRNAFEILKLLCDLPFMTSHLLELLATKYADELTYNSIRS